LYVFISSAERASEALAKLKTGRKKKKKKKKREINNAFITKVWNMSYR